MKDLTVYINEVSKGLAQRAYNKATGAQKNRIGKLYREIYGGDITKSDISHIDFKVDAVYAGEQERRIKSGFEKWPQDVLDTIHKVYVKVSDDDEELLEYNIYINDDREPWQCSWKLKRRTDDFIFVDSNFMEKEDAGDWPDAEVVIANIYEYAKTNNMKF